MSGSFTPSSPALHVEWECLACLGRSPYLLPPSREADDVTRLLSTSSFAGVASGDCVPTDECVGSASCGESGLSSPATVRAVRARRSPHGDAESAYAYDHSAGSALIPDDEEDSYVNAAGLESWQWQTTVAGAGTAPLGAVTHAQEEEERARQAQMLFTQQQERLLVEEGLLGKRQMRYCQHCGYARCAEVREVIPHDAGAQESSGRSMSALNSQAMQHERHERHVPPAPNIRPAASASPSSSTPRALGGDDGEVIEGREGNVPGRASRTLPGVVQHWWSKTRATAQRLHLLAQSSSSSSSSSNAGSSPSMATSTASAEVPHPSARARSARATTKPSTGADHVKSATPPPRTSEAIPPSPSSSSAVAAVVSPKEVLWRAYSIESAFWRLTLPDAATPFLDGPRAVSSAPVVSTPSTPTTPERVGPGGRAGNASPSPFTTTTPSRSTLSSAPGRRVGYRQEVKSALEKLDNVQLNVARMRLEQALQLLAEEEQHRRMSHN